MDGMVGASAMCQSAHMSTLCSRKTLGCMSCSALYLAARCDPLSSRGEKVCSYSCKIPAAGWTTGRQAKQGLPNQRPTRISQAVKPKHAMPRLDSGNKHMAKSALTTSDAAILQY